MLTEAQARRYSRHVLLREVGGTGQASLLASPVRVRGGGTALEVAAAYLAAGGSPLHWQGPEYGAFFLAGEAAQAVVDLNPDAEGPVDEQDDLDPARLEADAGTVCIGPETLAWFPAPVCADCIAAQKPGRGGPQVGALAAVAMQRLILGLEKEAGALTLDLAGGNDARVPCLRCAAHR